MRQVEVAQALKQVRAGLDVRRSVGSILLFARQELLDKHRQNALGIFWLVFEPMVFVVLFTTVFSHFMQARLGPQAGPYDYAVYLGAGLLCWNLFANTVANLVGVFQAKAGLITKIPIDLGLMPLYIPMVELVLYAVAMVAFACFVVLVGWPVTWVWLYLIPVVALLILFAYGLGLTLAILSVFLPDTRNFVRLMLQFGFWMTPVVYQASMLPQWALTGLAFNPVFWAIDAVHGILVWGRPPEWQSLVKLSGIAAAALLGAGLLKSKLERHIRDLL